MSEFFRNAAEAAAQARSAADDVRVRFNIQGDVDVSIFLGTGWGDAFTFERTIPMDQVSGFRDIPKLEGHAREIALTEVDGRKILIHRGRIHNYEGPFNNNLRRMLRTQAEMDYHLGVRCQVLTCAAGSLKQEFLPGDVVVVDGFVTAFAPPRPTIGGEHYESEEVLDPRLQEIALSVPWGDDDPQIRQGGYVMTCGPDFESRRYDKAFFAMTGASCVGMSLIPTCHVARVYNERHKNSDWPHPIKVLALAFISNDATEEHSHQVNRERAVERKETLGRLLRHVIHNLP